MTKRVILILLLSIFFCAPVVAEWEWSEDQKDKMTEAFQRYVERWTTRRTDQFLKKLDGQIEVIGTLKTDSGKDVVWKFSGGTIFLDGKDISGGLGDKTTFGPNSPIIEDVQNSQFTTGNKSPIKKDIVSNTTVRIYISLSVALTISIGLNIALGIALKRQKAANKALHPISESPRLPEMGEC